MTLAKNCLAALMAAALAAGVVPAVQAAPVTDDFSDLNDTANPTWTRLGGLVGSLNQTWDASTGQYRLTALNNGASLPGFGRLGSVASYTGPSYSNVRVSADFVQNATGFSYGVVARTNGVDGLAALSGYGYFYEPLAAGGLGEMVLYRINPDVNNLIQDIGSQQVTLDIANKDYTFVLEIVGDQLHGRVFEIGGGLVAERFATDSTYASGFSGVLGYSGSGVNQTTDFTIDNFRTVPEPAAGALAALAAAGAAWVRRRR